MARSISKKSKSPETAPIIKEKFVQQNMGRLNEFVPTDPQKVLINKIKENTITFCDSPAGSGKSSSVLWHFCKEYLTDRHKKIIIVRTPVEFSDDRIGFLPNGLDDKLRVHFESSQEILEGFLGAGKVATDIGSRIFFKIPNYMLGATISDTLLLIDEAQQLSPQILKLLLERIGDGCKVVVAGSSEQLFDAHNKRNGLNDAINRFFDYDNETQQFLQRFDSIAYHEFDVEDCMRNSVVKDVIRAYRGE